MSKPHTPLPWKPEENYGRHWISAGKGKKKIQIADVSDVETNVGSGMTDTDAQTTRANATFIARACNSFESLLAACKAARRRLWQPADRPEMPDADLDRLLTEAIKQAEGKP
jgi:hypothetical protein